MVTLVLMFWVFMIYYQEKNIPGWSSITIPIAFFGGIQMISIGVIGDYVGKIYMEVKRRPRYIIEKGISKK